MDPPHHLYSIITTEAPTLEYGETPAVLVKEKIHIFSLDWAAFKQIRSPDIMAHFADYGPSYVEWLNDYSCNILFDCEYSAARALANCTMELPSPPPTTADVTTTETSDETNEEEQPPQSMTDDSNTNTNNNNNPPPPPKIDYGAMGWRFGKYPLYKISNDIFGRKGTRSRILARTATSLDLLEQRPTNKPRPPRGFTTRRVLGPGTEARAEQREKNNRRNNSSRRGPKRRRRNNRNNARDEDIHHVEGDMEEEEEYDDDDDYEEDGMVEEEVTVDAALNTGLKSSRAGFSVEEMEKERAEKKLQGS
mmetsp:Transcript_25103/g.36457  ORF Transcript_25103/g.36457 Transcript_25103/m.36457 type:complete len:307 (+) Transcript_25103:518-1438(+)